MAEKPAVKSALYTIAIAGSGDPVPPDLPVGPGDKIRWRNDLGKTITAFALPSCVSPPTSPAPIAPGKQTRSYTVKKGKLGRFHYAYVWDDVAKGTRSGVIDVGNM
ncbi:hypothetical protein FBQ97_04325 [Acidobacteria bacterium ACD]|nr:MAG: hypothetical protein EDX89_08735 [Acidobacteriota bacterium]MCE7960658.1 hypothetical protein [Acidobacteria bacterium ACB2]MDL1949024.1 hypothetical protein [Acidobacteria bacterium ACD]